MLTEDQQKIRKSGIGASEISALSGSNPWRHTIDVWRDKMGLSQYEESEQTQIGNVLEQPIADMIARKLGIKIMFGGETLTHPQHKHTLATPDYYILDVADRPVGLLQIKNVGYRSVDAWDCGPPAYVIEQVQQEMAVCGLSVAIVGALVGGRELRHYEIKASPKMQADLIALAEHFFSSYIDTKTPPPVDASESWAKYLSATYPQSEPIMAPCVPDAAVWAQRLKDARNRKKEAEELEDLAINNLKNLLGNAQGMIGENWRVSWKETRGSIDYHKLIEEESISKETIEKFRRPENRQFRFYDRGEK